MTVAIDKLINEDIMKPARYLGNELGSVHKDWESADVRWVLTYPEIYEVGASNLGHIILYNVINAQPRQLCDRAYLPDRDLAQKLRDTETPLFALEARRPLTDYDILGFSLSYELGGTNILEMLDLAGIPLTWQDRKNTDFPLIFAGGQTATSNPEPFADFFDFIALGDGEELLPEIGLIIEEGKKAGLSREDLLLDLAQVPGVYVPMFYDMAEDGSVHPNRPDVPKRILRRVAAPMPDYSIGLVPLVETVHDRLTVEIRRGCTRGCRFCQPGMLTRPARDVEPEKVVDTIEKGMRETGYNEFSLLSLSCSDYLSLPAVGMEVKNRLKDENISLSLPSQRVDRFDENIANVVGGLRQTGLTFAPEAGTQRMRDVINKGLTNEELLRGIKTAVEQGWDKVKLYFMIGLPGETDADVLGIAETLRWLRRECAMKGRKKLSFNVTISNFTPKPHTPFQWHSVSTSEFVRKQELLRQELKQVRGVKANFTDVRFSAMEDFLGRGDRTLAPVIRRAWELGAGMDAWMEGIDRAFDAWEQAISDSGLSWRYRAIQAGEWNIMDSQNTPIESKRKRKQYSWDERLNRHLPWDHINTGIDKDWLKGDLQRALDAATVPDCAFEGCSQCGICGVDFGHNVVYEPPPIPEFAGQFEPPQQRVQRLRVRFGKLGENRLLSHLDLVRLWERVVRRASLPISFNGGYHPMPRISITSALSLGMTSSGEIVDFELRERMDAKEFQARLVEQLPIEIPIYRVEEVDLQTKSANRLLEKAEYTLEVAAESPDWENWINAVNSRSEIIFEKTTKSGKVRQINLCDRLHSLTLDSLTSEGAKLRYIGSYTNDGNILQPEHLIYMLEQVSGQIIELLHAHREGLILAE
ncbi:TIGR03960 family B12-binding radical SAM protein [Spirulina sp. CS-785/01]|uniref:TIGR03960 family B12-binding radical SAM protein n=1 Tax=Spirulina sp. CS-785/01 TaxID=3021716 RepID=UPI00232B320B|nr:TIGR03960 family B12-binding radical SAM protein [Spirulina sp. CS-785/01]MDB9315263.1 TIGR03960 family B12-binding radical SAM protein [Spirulina sp. CS-785/01]